MAVMYVFSNHRTIILLLTLKNGCSCSFTIVFIFCPFAWVMPIFFALDLNILHAIEEIIPSLIKISFGGYMKVPK